MPGRGGPGRIPFRIELGADAELLLDLLLDPVGQVRVVAQEVPGVLLALAELVAVVGVPGAGLAHDALLHAEIDKAALTANSVTVQNIEFRDFEWRRHFILDDFYPGSVSDRICSVFQGLDAADIKSNRCIELQRLPASGRLRNASEHDAYLFPQLINKNSCGLCLVKRAGYFPEGLRHQPGLQANMAVAHLPLNLGARHQRRYRVDDDDVDGAGADQHVRDL